DRRRSLVFIASAADEEQPFGCSRFVGFDDCQPVLPDWAINIFFSAPLLRSQLEDESLITLARYRIDQLPRINRIRFRDVAVERGLLSARGNNSQRDCRRAQRCLKKSA